jgi:UDP-glucose 4-epimerase
VVFHLAATVGVQLVVGHPRHVIETNVMGTECVLRASLRHSKRVVIASTSEVYGKSNGAPLAEDNDAVFGATSKPQWSYGAGKMVAEMLSHAYATEYGLDVVIFRPFNIIGPRQVGRHGMVVPRFVRQALRGEALTIYGDGSQKRCFCNVDDAVRALIGLAASERATGRVFNIGGTEEISMRELAIRVRDLTASSSTLRNVTFEDAYGLGFENIYQRVPDISRLKQLLGWAPSRSLDDILREVIAYEIRKMSKMPQSD